MVFIPRRICRVQCAFSGHRLSKYGHASAKHAKWTSVARSGAAHAQPGGDGSSAQDDCGAHFAIRHIERAYGTSIEVPSRSKASS